MSLLIEFSLKRTIKKKRGQGPSKICLDRSLFHLYCLPCCLSFFLKTISSGPFLNTDLTDSTSVSIGMSTIHLHFLSGVFAFTSTESS